MSETRIGEPRARTATVWQQGASVGLDDAAMQTPRVQAAGWSPELYAIQGPSTPTVCSMAHKSSRERKHATFVVIIVVVF